MTNYDVYTSYLIKVDKANTADALKSVLVSAVVDATLTGYYYELIEDYINGKLSALRLPA